MINPPNVVMIFNNDVVDEKEYYEIVSEVLTQDSTVQVLHQNRLSWASLDIFVPNIEVILSPENLQGLYYNLLSDVLSAAIITAVSVIWNHFHKKATAKKNAVGIEEVNPNIQLIAGNHRLILPVNIDLEKYQYAVNQFIMTEASKQSEELCVSYYIEEIHDIETRTEQQIIDKAVKREQEAINE